MVIKSKTVPQIAVPIYYATSLSVNQESEAELQDEISEDSCPSNHSRPIVYRLPTKMSLVQNTSRQKLYSRTVNDLLPLSLYQSVHVQSDLQPTRLVFFHSSLHSHATKYTIIESQD